MSKKTKAARLSVISNSLLIVLKLTAGIISGSVSIISEAIHSFMDLLAALIAFFSVKVSDRPADDRHPYGHWKIENISGVIESFLIFVAAVWIIYEAVHKILVPAEVETIGLGFAVMCISAFANMGVSWYLYKIAKETGSIALEADALHLKTDVYTSLGVAAGLGLIWLTGYHILDPVVAILVSMLILRESYSMLIKAYKPLLDESLDIEEIKMLRNIIESYCKENSKSVLTPGQSPGPGFRPGGEGSLPGEIKYHGLRTRKAGNFSYIDFHLNLDENLTVKEAHELCDRIEEDIKQHFVNCEVTIHVENF